MLNDKNSSVEKREIAYAVFFPAVTGFLIILSFILEKGMDWDFHKAGIYPRQPESLGGIFSIIFVHADWSHLANNIVSYEVLATFLYLFYKQLATQVLLISYIASGILLWIIGRESWHIGASGLVYSLAFFLFFSGLIRKHVPLIAVSLVVAFVYGSMVWHLFPWQKYDPVSWEGHLAGGTTGLVLAILYRKTGPQKPVKIWEDEDDDAIEYIEEDDDTDLINK